MRGVERPERPSRAFIGRTPAGNRILNQHFQTPEVIIYAVLHL
jgi:hypothetical protein